MTMTVMHRHRRLYQQSKWPPPWPLPDGKAVACREGQQGSASLWRARRPRVDRMDVRLCLGGDDGGDAGVCSRPCPLRSMPLPRAGVIARCATQKCPPRARAASIRMQEEFVDYQEDLAWDDLPSGNEDLPAYPQHHNGECPHWELSRGVAKHGQICPLWARHVAAANKNMHCEAPFAMMTIHS